ncbi:MAG TPA: stage III sporulation protein AG [Candidatus Pelethomonas intestinigallinarum]|nr:stage III sporulation protein AG [Candidatus Pelethomonas intestinigallinarum]
MTREEEKGKLPKPLAALLRYKYVLLVAAAGVALLLWPESPSASLGGSAQESAQTAGAEEALREMESAMEDILEKIQGVGQVDVMLTLQSGGELVLAEDSSLRYSGSTQSPDDYDRSSQTVTVSGDSGQDVVVTQEICPQYRGALVVCEGGGSDGVRLQVVEAVSALTGLGADRIAVVQWRVGGGGGSTEGGTAG